MTKVIQKTWCAQDKGIHVTKVYMYTRQETRHTRDKGSAYDMEYTRRRNSQDIGVHNTKVIQKKLITQDKGTYKTKVTQMK